MSIPDRLIRAAALDPNLADEPYLMVTRALRGLDPITGEPARDPQPTSGVLPAPPDGDTRWSIVTLAQHLCVPVAAVHTELTPGEDGDSDDFHSNRLFVSYDVDGEDYGDCWLTAEAAARIAGDLHTGLLARRITSVEDARLAPADQVLALARHIVTHLGGER